MNLGMPICSDVELKSQNSVESKSWTFDIKVEEDVDFDAESCGEMALTSLTDHIVFHLKQSITLATGKSPDFEWCIVRAPVSQESWQEINMQALALALLVAPCGAFFHGGAPVSGLLALRSRAARLGVQRPLCTLPRVSRLFSAPSSRATLRMDGQPPHVVKFPCLHQLACKGRVTAPCPFALGGCPGDVAAASPPDKEGMELGKLARILRDHSSALDHTHLSAAWVCLARIASGRGGAEVRGVFHLLEDRTWDVLEQAGGRGLAPIMHSMARLYNMGLRTNAGLLEAMQRRATATAGGFEPHDVVDVLWALATMGVRAERGLLEAVGARATATVGKYKSNEVLEVLWALAVTGEDGILFDLRDRLAARVLHFRDKLDKTRVYQWLLSCELNLLSGASLPSSVARVKQEMGEECLLAFSGQTTHESRLQQDVAAVLRTVWSDVELEEEYCCPRSGLSIDILVRPRAPADTTSGVKSPAVPPAEWAVEVDGPTHFLGMTQTPSGKTLLKRKRLGQLGYTMVSVPFFEWRALKGERAQRRYLQDKLRGG